MIQRRTFLKGAIASVVGLSVGLLGWQYDVQEPDESLPFAAPWTWSVTLNAAGMARSKPGPYLDLARDLGVSLIRVDLSWNVLQPEADHWRSDREAWYRALIQAARQRGLGVIANLTDYPGWALRELASEPHRFDRDWYAFVARMAHRLDSGIAYYQMGNEFNSVLDPIPADRDAQVFLVARRALEDRLGDALKSRIKTVINPFFGFNQVGSEWDPALHRVLEKAADAIDVLALDYYPGSYNPFGNPRDWSPFASLTTYARQYGKLLAVGETGCPSLLGKRHQARWLQESIPALSDEIRLLGVEDRMTFMCLFELVDRDQLAWWELWRPTEVTLGLADRDLKPKPGFYVIQGFVQRSRPVR